VGRAARGHEVRPDALVVRKGAPLLVAVVPSLTVLGRLGVVGGVPAAAVEWSGSNPHGELTQAARSKRTHCFAHTRTGQCLHIHTHDPPVLKQGQGHW
jgi:hypothetical protein